ncbi:GlcG/HbpS family heme-binding protein [Psychromonas sp. GE-S-Ul-11]|uniref:GlcG/HbpS family heme-binding protein n=1 Tax=Psychromonas sp. GE-S-Ul-11 TaxID=3241170 RepID=UPI00390C6336
MSDYYVKNLAVSLPLKDAVAIIDNAIEIGHQHGLLPLTVVVLDVGGNIIAIKREDGCGIMRVDIAAGKAWGALGMGISSREIRDRLADRPSFQAALASTSQGRFVPVPGGVLICNEETEVIGAVGISGDASDKDEYCAIAAINTTKYLSHPEKPNDKWQNAGL